MSFIYGSHKATTIRESKSRWLIGLSVADPATTASPILWPGHPGEHQEQLGECLLLEISLVLKWWGTCVLRKTACHALQDTACLDLDWSTEPSPMSAARVAPEKGLNASEDLP